MDFAPVAQGRFLDKATRSPVGYFAFEQLAFCRAKAATTY
ncbi:hypothetical protein AB395_00004051 [Sinorhizobium fredii CCBAU 45436]|nr:hypothetical protein AB395_00004051 [Sinorhizobium fredii CCBAU 45436]